jgi:transposase
LDQNSTIIAVVELSQSSWLVGGVAPGIERQPCKKLEPSPERLLAVLHRWRDEAVRAGRTWSSSLRPVHRLRPVIDAD